MNNEIIKLSVLTFLAGLFCKIYDDLNDNNLFNYFLLDKNKEYINEFLKATHYILLIYVSSKYIYPLLFFLMPITILMIKDPTAYELPYEYSGCLAFFLFSFYLIINNFSQFQQLFFNYFTLAFMVATFAGTYVLEILLGIHNIEFGYKKLASRVLPVFVMSAALVINYYFKLVPHELVIYLWYIIGYCLTSCFFQILLILKSQKQDVTPDDTSVDKQVDVPDDKQVDKQVDVPDDKPDVTPDDKQ